MARPREGGSKRGRHQHDMKGWGKFIEAIGDSLELQPVSRSAGEGRGASHRLRSRQNVKLQDEVKTYLSVRERKRGAKKIEDRKRKGAIWRQDKKIGRRRYGVENLR